MGNVQREAEILNILKEKNYVTVEYLAQSIHISSSSIRRDLASLERRGLVKRDHGGVALPSFIPGTAPFATRLHENRKQKLSIVRTAATLVIPDSSLYVDSSATAVDIHKYLTPDMNLKVFTNNIMLAHLLAAKKIKCYCIGGCISEHNNVITTGTYALDMLKSIYVDFMFFSASALSEEGIISDINEEETAIRKAMLFHAKTKIFLCQRNRFGVQAPFGLTDVCELDYVVSSFEFPEDFIKRSAGVTFLKA